MLTTKRASVLLLLMALPPSFPPSLSHPFLPLPFLLPLPAPILLIFFLLPLLSLLPPSLLYSVVLE